MKIVNLTLTLGLSLVFLIFPILGVAGDSVSYKYSDHKYTQIKYNSAYFKEILLERDLSNIDKYKREKQSILKYFPESHITPFNYIDFDNLHVSHKTVIIVFDDITDEKYLKFKNSFIPLRNYLDKHPNAEDICGTSSFSHLDENSVNFLIVMTERGERKDLSYVINFKLNIQKIESYENRYNCFKPTM